MNSEMFNKMLKNHMGESVLIWAEEDVNSSKYDSGEIGVTEEYDEPVLAYIESTGTAGARNDYIYPLQEGDKEMEHPWVQLLLIEGQYRWYEAPHKNLGTFHKEWEEKVEYREFEY